MFDFGLDTKWDVDKSAESLNTSLFGKIKKKKTQILKVVESAYTTHSESAFSKTVDSDDEHFSKKGKKKLKERRRKNNKKDRAAEKSNDENQHILQVKKFRKEAQDGEKSNIQIDDNEQRAILKAHSISKAKVIKKNKKTEISSLLEKKGKKRNLSISEARDTLGSNKAKKLKIDKNVVKSELVTKTNGDSTAGSKVKHDINGSKSEGNSLMEGTTKRKRKKKNTSKKNREKQLALRAKIKPSLAVIWKDSEFDKPCDLYNAKEHDQNKFNETEATFIKNSVAVSLEKNSAQLDSTNSASNQGQKTLISGAVKKCDMKNKNKAVIKKSKAETHELHSEPVLNATKQLLKKNKEKKSESKKRRESNASLSDQQISHPTSKKLEPLKLKQQKLVKMLSQSEEMSNANKDPGVEIIAKKGKQKIESSSAVPFDRYDLKNSHQNNKDAETKLKTCDQSNSEISEAAPSLWGKAAALGQQAKDKLKSARFRFINEQLYSCTGSEAMKMFRNDRTAFNVYHEGYERQVSKWPVNPLDMIIRQIKDKPRNLVVADFGCGDAKLAQSIPQKVHSFDLVATNSRVTACDMSKTPLPNESVDIAVFCLSLMGTNISDYIQEANRVLKVGGLLKVAEVVSRFSGLSQFIGGISKHGFLLLNKRDLNQMFYMIDFKKIKSVKKTSAGTIKLKPCVYKRR